jgi:hypothetical protein
MWYQCSTCDKKFTNKRNFQYHQENIDCLARAHICSICLRKFASRQRLNSHKATQHLEQKEQPEDGPPADVNDKLKLQLELERMRIQLEKIKLEQMKEETKQKQEETKQKQVELQKEMAKKTVVKIKNKRNVVTNTVNSNNNTVNSNNNTVNSNNNNTVNVQIIAFGKEDVEKYLKEHPDVLRGLAHKPNICVPELVKHIHCNPELPQYRNVYISQRTPSIAMVYDGEQFIHRDAEEIIERVYSDKKEIMYEYVDENGHRLSSFVKNRHDQLKNSTDQNKKDKREIKLRFMSNEEGTKMLKKQIESSKNKLLDG